MKPLKLIAACLAAIAITVQASAQNPVKIETGLISGIKSTTSNLFIIKYITNLIVD